MPNFIGHKLRGLFIQREPQSRKQSEHNIFEVESSRASDNALLASRTKILLSLIPRQERNQACSHGVAIGTPWQLEAWP